MSALDHLLDGQTLTYRSDSDLIRSLNVLRQGVIQYNEYARQSNHNLTIMGLNEANRRNIHAYAVQKYQVILTNRSTVLMLLSMSNYESRRSGIRAELAELRADMGRYDG